MVGHSPAHTSVPRWPDAPADIDRTGVRFLVVSAGPAGAAVAADWIDAITAADRPVWHHHADRPDAAPNLGPGCASALAQRLAGASVGVRIMVAGPELVVLDCLAAAREAGALDAEITAHVTSTELKRVYCPHCGTRTVATVAISARVGCSGCDRRLVVHPHLSRRHGAYLGSMADPDPDPDPDAA